MSLWLQVITAGQQIGFTMSRLEALCQDGSDVQLSRLFQDGLESYAAMAC